MKELAAFLNGLVFTAPYSVDDAKALYEAAHRLTSGCFIDVHSPTGKQVFVEIRTAQGTLKRTYDVS